MGDVKKRWSVTYTKHVKQKRKVYQDGFLELHDSSQKIMLYDDCEKLLVCRILKNDDVVKSGETLEFNSYLVDIGDLDGDLKTIPNVNLPARDKKTTDKAGLIHGHKFKHHSVPIDRKPDSGKNKAPSSSLSPSQKVIREFKKNEMNKYGAPRNSSDPTKTSYSEWNVLYTTQITQKAKKYHDGILRVATCGSQARQVTLYDVSRRLLDNRFLKKDEVIGSGESLAFDGHLVDILEPEGDHKPPVDLKVQGRNCTAGGRTGLSHGQQTQHSSIGEPPEKDLDTNFRGFHADNFKLERRVPMDKPLCEEIKKTEMNKYGTPRNCLDASKSSYSEWTVLYTTQITQKAKKYHDGLLRVATCGYQGRQVTLYDVGRRLLDSRFLKKDEVIGSGESIALDGHLVDIGEPEGDHNASVELKVQERNCTAGGKTGFLHGQLTQPRGSVEIENFGSSNNMSPPNGLKAFNAFTREWHALYTTQKTQKAKKYHSGFLRLASCNSYQMQATLLNEEGTILSRKFLKLFEDVRSGSTFELPKYLVEVGDPCTSPEGEPSKSASSEKAVDFRAIDVDDFKLERRVPIDNPLRDASGILSILKKTMTQEGSVPLKSTSAKECHALQSSESIQFDPRNQVERYLVRDSNSENSEADNHDEAISKRLKLETLLPIQITTSADSENIGETQLKYTFTSNSSLRSRASDISSPRNSDAECTDKSILRPFSSVEKPQVLDAFKLNCSDNFPLPTASAPDYGTRGDSLKSISSNVSLSCHGNPFSEELKIGTSPPPDETRCHDGDFSGGIMNSNGCKSHEPSDSDGDFSGGIMNSNGCKSHEPSDSGRQNSNGCTSHDPSESGKQNSKESKSTSKMDEIPSFDLGF